MSKHPLKPGEKILLSVFGVFFGLAVIGYIALETFRIRSEKPLFVQTTHFDFSEDGKKGSLLYREANCNSCHRALKSGTSMGLSLDGIGSRRSLEWLKAFLQDPEATYRGNTIDHGVRPKEAAYVASLPEESRNLIAVFLSELRADRGSSVAEEPPPGPSPFIDNMVKAWAPDSWKEKYTDIRERSNAQEQQQQQEPSQ
jgi:hypothetical protein